MSDPGAAALASAPWDMPPFSAGFDARGGWLINRLVKDLAPLTPIQASGIVGNLGGESGLDPDINEIAPLVQGSLGGLGWEQATGSRRRGLIEWASEHGLTITPDGVNSPDEDKANYGFLISELMGPEAHALDRLRQTTTVDTAVYTFEVLFERPSDPQGGLASRVHFAQRALAAATNLPAPPGPTLPPQPAPVPVPSESEAAILNRIEAERIARREPELSPEEVARRMAQIKAGQGTAPVPTPPVPAPVPAPAPPVIMAPAPVIIPPARTTPGVAIAGGTGFLASFAGTIQFLWPANFPYPSPTEAQATNLAVFAMSSVALLFHLWANRRHAKALAATENDG